MLMIDDDDDVRNMDQGVHNLQHTPGEVLIIYYTHLKRCL